MIFYSLLQVTEEQHDVILFDVAPSISHLQTCAAAYTRNTLIPIGMDNLSVEGALSSLQTIDLLNRMLKLDCKCVGFLPTMIDQRLSATEVVLHALHDMARTRGIPLLPGIRTDQAVNRSLRSGRFLQLRPEIQSARRLPSHLQNIDQIPGQRSCGGRIKSRLNSYVPPGPLPRIWRKPLPRCFRFRLPRQFPPL